MNKGSVLSILVLAVLLCPLPGMAQFHYSLSSDWVTGNGVYVVVDEVEFFGNDLRGNRALYAANIDGNSDPLHAWINQDFGTDYTVRCDVRMESWLDGQDLGRSGIAVRIAPQETNGQDRGVNLLFHEDFNTVEYLNDFRAWANTDDGAFAWEKGVMYTMELSVTGNTVNGTVTRADDPGVSITLAPWEFADRPSGFAGITGSNVQGQVTVFDNFEVIVDGQTVFSDDFEGDLQQVSQVVGLSEDWVAGEGGYWVVNDGVLYGISTSRLDPKKIWYREELTGGAAISADVQMLSWHEDVFIPGANADFSRSGLALHTQPHGRGGGREPSERGPGEDRAIMMLFHDNINTIEFLNDHTAWAGLDDDTIPWDTNTWYTFDFRSDGFVVDGTFTERGDDASAIEMTPWEFPGVDARFDGFAGLGISTTPGEVAAFDNVVIRNEAGDIVFSDDFETFTNVNQWSIY